ncbi:hypothetical protein DXG01_014738 [Tephrocybe rancida]|nr:hypothetical protein DXG01_014738 [Tephrocybe rancida]
MQSSSTLRRCAGRQSSDKHPPIRISFARGFEGRDSAAYAVTSVICDMNISLSLVYFLNKLRTGFRSSENIINRLVLFSINVGLLTSAIAICALIAVGCAILAALAVSDGPTLTAVLHHSDPCIRCRPEHYQQFCLHKLHDG